MAREQLATNAHERGKAVLAAHRRDPGAIFLSEHVRQFSLGASGRSPVNEGRDAIFAFYREGRIGRLFRVASDSRNDAGLRNYARDALGLIVSRTEGIETDYARRQLHSARMALERLDTGNQRRNILQFPVSEANPSGLRAAGVQG